MHQWLIIGIICLLLSACGSQPIKPRVDPQQVLIAALVAQDRNQIMANKSQVKLKIKNSMA